MVYVRRCTKEWQPAVHLHRDGHLSKSQLIVAAVEMCKRPDPLRTYLYLDFVDGRKRENVCYKRSVRGIIYFRVLPRQKLRQSVWAWFGRSL